MPSMRHAAICSGMFLAPQVQLGERLSSLVINSFGSGMIGDLVSTPARLWTRLRQWGRSSLTDKKEFQHVVSQFEHGQMAPWMGHTTPPFQAVSGRCPLGVPFSVIPSFRSACRKYSGRSAARTAQPPARVLIPAGNFSVVEVIELGPRRVAQVDIWPLQSSKDMTERDLLREDARRVFGVPAISCHQTHLSLSKPCRPKRVNMTS